MLLSISEVSEIGVSTLDDLLIRVPAAYDVAQLPLTTTTSASKGDEDG